ncbi:MAG: winged helix-turn-helix transcriptional regulator [Alphaproteobacteria bacterium]
MKDDQKKTECPTELTLSVISGKWKILVIHWLLEGPMRFNQLQRELGGITHRTLSKQLKEMECDGLITRKDYGEIPPRVDYRLTALGKSLAPILYAMEEWALTHGRRIKKAQSA